MRKVVYTVLTGDYDDLKEPAEIDPTWDYICFTDNPDLKSDTWEIRLLDNPWGLSQKKLSRRPKILYHEYLPDYDLVVYVDACYKIISKLDPFALSKANDIYIQEHISRKCAYTEGRIVHEKGIDSKEIIDKQLGHYRHVGFPENYGLYMCSIIVRNQSNKIHKLMEAWWQEVLTHSFRDQVSFTYACWKTNVKPKSILQGICSQYFIQHFHKWPLNPNFKVHYITPYADNKEIGVALNDACNRADDSDWICLRDGDTMFLDSFYGDYIKDIIRKYPDTHLFGCMTNRVGLEWQLHGGVLSDCVDIVHHKKIASFRKKKYGTECEVINKQIAGFFMLFPKRVWNLIKFQKPLIAKDGIYFDWRFSTHILNHGGIVRLIKGLYLFHFYRLDKENVKDISHLL